MANNELLRFRKGTHANLVNQDIVAGTVYVTTDEKAMYVDISATERIRLGQIVNFATLTEFQNFLNTTIPPYSEEAFYYVEDKNALLKWVSSDNTTSVGGVETKGTWKQINSTSAVTEAINGVSNRVTALEGTVGNASSGLVKDVATLKTTVGDANSGLVKDVATNATDIDTLEEAIVTGENAKEGTIGKLVTQIGADLDVAEGEIDALQTLTNGHTTTIGEHTTAIGNLNTALTNYKTEVGNTYATKTELANEKKALQEEIDSDVAAEATLRLQGDQANANAINTINTKIGNAESGMVADIARAQATADDAQADFDAWEQAHLNDYTNTQIDNKIKVAKDAADAAQADADANAKAINGLTATVNKLDGADTVEGSVKQQIKVAKEALQAEIDADIRAANAMEFEKGVSASSELPTSAKNGATCVAKASFTLAGGEQVRPGDLLIATGTEDATTGLITNPSWTLVHTGYDASLEQTLDTVDGKIALTSKVGGTASTVSFVAAEGSAATVSVANNTVTVGIEWDNF